MARWIVLSLPLSLALIFVPGFAAPFSTPKTAVFGGSTFLLAGLVLLVMHARPQRNEYLFRITTLGYVALVAVSAVASPLRYMSLQPCAFAVAGVLLFGAARCALAGKTRALLVTISVAALVAALITVAQFCNLNPLEALGMSASFSGRMRMYSSLGNPNFVAAFLAAAIPAPLALSLRGGHDRGLGIASGLLIAVAVLLTGSRAGVLGMAAAVVAFAVMAIDNRAARWLMFGAVALVCIVVPATHFNSRTVSESASGRIFIWRVALSDGAAGSAFGSGPGSFAYLYPAKMGRFFSESGREPLLRFTGHERHAQNDFVEAWCDTGWLGLVSLLAVFGAWLFVACRLLSEGNGRMRHLTAAAMAGVAAVGTVALFDFPLHRAETWALLWLWMAVPFVEQEPPVREEHRPSPLRLCAAALLALLGSYYAFAQVASSYWLGHGQTQERHGRVELAREAYQSSLRWDTSSPDANFNLVRATAKAGDLPGAVSQSRLASRFVNEPELIILRSRIEQNAGQSDAAVRELEAGVRLFPYSQELREELASSK